MIPSAHRHVGRMLAAAAFVVTTALSVGTASAQPSSQRAIDLYGEGRKLLSAGKPAEALPRLDESLALLPSPNTELLIAHAHRELGHVVVALRAYKHVAETAAAEIAKGQDKYKDAQAEAERWQRELVSAVGTIVIQGPAGLEVDVRSTTSADVVHAKPGDRVWVDAGEVIVTPTTGGALEPQRVTVAKGASQLVTFVAKEAPPPPPPSDGGGSGPVISVPGIIVGSVGLAALGVSAAFGGLALSIHGDLESCQAGDPCASSFEDDRSTGETYKTVTNAMLGTGLGLVAAGATIWIIQAVMDDGGAAAQAAFGGAPTFDAGDRSSAGAVIFGRF